MYTGEDMSRLMEQSTVPQSEKYIVSARNIQMTNLTRDNLQGRMINDNANLDTIITHPVQENSL